MEDNLVIIYTWKEIAHLDNPNNIISFVSVFVKSYLLNVRQGRAFYFYLLIEES